MRLGYAEDVIGTALAVKDQSSLTWTRTRLHYSGDQWVVELPFKR
jgi:hypothetical protein